MAEDRLNRREFAIRSARVVLSGSLLTVVLEGCADSSVDTPTGPSAGTPTGPLDNSNGSSPPTTTLTLDLNDPKYAALKEVGGAVKVPLSGRLPLIVSHVSASTYVAFTSQCQHDGCEVGLPDERGVITCPCHGSQYDLEGRKLRGPTPRDLPRVEVKVEDGQLTITP
jgi:Rieske Fe-S protein